MNTKKFATQLISCAAIAAAAGSAFGLSNQTFVATGPSASDSNPCTSALPCATIDHALTVTSVGGEIVIASSGVYAPATITQAVDINVSSNAEASIVAATSGTNAITINTTGNVSINGLTLRGQGTGNDGILVTQVGVLRLNNMTIRNFLLNGIEFQSSGSAMNMFNSQSNSNGHDGLQVNASGAKAYVEGSAFDSNGFAGGDSVDGKLTISDSNAHYNDIGFYSNGGSVTLYNARAIFNTIGFKVSAAGHLHFADCLLSDNTTGWDVAAGGVLSGSDPGTTLVAPGQTPNKGVLSVATVLK